MQGWVTVCKSNLTPPRALAGLTATMSSERDGLLEVAESLDSLAVPTDLFRHMRIMTGLRPSRRGRLRAPRLNCFHSFEVVSQRGDGVDGGGRYVETDAPHHRSNMASPPRSKSRDSILSAVSLAFDNALCDRSRRPRGPGPKDTNGRSPGARKPRIPQARSKSRTFDRALIQELFGEGRPPGGGGGPGGLAGSYHIRANRCFWSHCTWASGSKVELRANDDRNCKWFCTTVLRRRRTSSTWEQKNT